MELRLKGEGRLHRRVYDALRAQMLDGTLPAGARLPSSRALAADNGVSRMTVQLAYEQLAAEGYTRSRHGSGTYVADGLTAAAPAPRRRLPPPPDASALAARVTETTPLFSSRGHGRERPRWDFRPGLPALRDFPHAHWRRLLGRQARRDDVAAYDYPPAEGAPALREAIARYVRRARGLACDPEQVLIVNGSQQGLDLIARLLLDPGDTALVEDPGYEGARSAFRVAGADVVGVPVDDDGLDLAAAPAAARHARLVHVTPSHQYPLGAQLSLPRRLALLDWARRAHAWVVEDDYDSEYRYDGAPLAPLKALDTHGRVIVVGTFSKVLFPALRLGYLLLPPSLVRLFRRAKALADGGTPRLEQETLAEWIRSGAFERHVRRARRGYQHRRATLVAAVRRHLGERVAIAGANAGLHVVLRFPGWSPAKAERVVRDARRADVGVYSLAGYHAGVARETGLLLGYGALQPAEIDEGIRRLASVLR